MSKITTFDVILRSERREIENVTEFGVSPVLVSTEQLPAKIGIMAAAYSYSDMFHLITGGSMLFNSTNYGFAYPTIGHFSISASISASWVFGAFAVVESV
jgi:hypothetical protein